MVDWSAASWPGPAGGGRDGLWGAIGEPGTADRAQPFRTRAEAAAWIQQELERLLDAGHHVLCGVDFALGFPSGTAAALGAPPDAQPWRWVWQLLDEAVEDDQVNRNNRFEVAARLNTRLGEGAGPFWGCPPDSAGPHLAPTKGAFPVVLPHGHDLGEYRQAERYHRQRGAQPKSVWQLMGAGAVGSQALLGIPYVHRIRHAPTLVDRCVVWPFETGFAAPALADISSAVLVEVYPSLLAPDPSLHEVRDAAQVLALVDAYRQMQVSGELDGAFRSPDTGIDAQRGALKEEGWILPISARMPAAGTRGALGGSRRDASSVAQPGIGTGTGATGTGAGEEGTGAALGRSHPGAGTIDQPATGTAGTGDEGTGTAGTGDEGTGTAGTGTAGTGTAGTDPSLGGSRPDAGRIALPGVPHTQPVPTAKSGAAGAVARGALLPSSAAPIDGERFVELLSHRGVVIEQIVSSPRPDQTTYVQAQDEWVLLLDGHAVLDVDGVVVTLAAGQHLFLPARTPHRVISTAQGSRWLAVHIHP